MTFLDKARSVAGTAAAKAKEGVEDIHQKMELGQLYSQLGKDAFELVQRGEVAHPTLEATAAKIRELQAKAASPAPATPQPASATQADSAAPPTSDEAAG